MKTGGEQRDWKEHLEALKRFGGRRPEGDQKQIVDDMDLKDPPKWLELQIASTPRPAF